MQSDIIAFMQNCENINLINDFVFLKFVVFKQNRHKFLFITHKDKKQLNVAIIKFKKFSFYVQKMMNEQFREFRESCRIYINDIISFFKLFNNYLIYFRRLFIVLIKLRVILNLKKKNIFIILTLFYLIKE